MRLERHHRDAPSGARPNGIGQLKQSPMAEVNTVVVSHRQHAAGRDRSQTL
jgi:hypothetical protein